jgi:hypothetical protein
MNDNNNNSSGGGDDVVATDTAAYILTLPLNEQSQKVMQNTKLIGDCIDLLFLHMANHKRLVNAQTKKSTSVDLQMILTHAVWYMSGGKQPEAFLSDLASTCKSKVW